MNAGWVGYDEGQSQDKHIPKPALGHNVSQEVKLRAWTAEQQTVSVEHGKTLTGRVCLTFQELDFLVYQNLVKLEITKERLRAGAKHSNPGFHHKATATMNFQCFLG